jgi:sarcosine oxidase
MPARNSHDVIVVGLGAMGSATAYQLAARGVRVLGLEQFDVPHALGSSHGSSRMIRLAYYEHADYVPLLRRAYTLWHQLEAECGRTIIHVTGGLYMGPPASPVVSGSLDAARRHGLSHETLDAAAVAKRFPQFHLPDDYRAMLDPDAGFVMPERAVGAYCDLAMRRGAELHGREPVLEWRADRAGVTVRTPRATYAAGHVVFCGGPWSGTLVRDLGVPLAVSRQVQAWVWPRRPERFDLGRMPVWAIDLPDDSFPYGFPLHRDGAPGLKLAFHGRGPTVDPDTVSREPAPEDELALRPILQRFLPDADGPLLSLRVCLYTNSPDHAFIVDRHPTVPNVTLACGFSGHGFKFASVMGAAIADLATTGASPLPVGFLGLGRFAGGPDAR